MKASVVVCVGVAALACACGQGTRRGKEPIRLVDLYRPEAGSTSATTPAKTVQTTEIQFTSAPNLAAAPKGAKPASPWAAGPGVADLKVREGHLTGRTLAPFPILQIRLSRSDDRDVLHEVHVRMRASAGANLSILFRNTDEVDLKWETENAPIIPWPLNTPIVAGHEMRTYTMHTTASIPMASRHLLIRPSDVAGATFDIESVRIVSRREHLASIRSGWAGKGWERSIARASCPARPTR